MKNKKSERLLADKYIVFLLATLCCALWGSAFPAVKTGYSLLGIGSGDTSSQLLFAGVRFTLAGIFVLVFGSIIRRKPLTHKLSSAPKVAVIALFQTVLQYSFFYIGLANSSGTNSSIIDSTSTFVAILLSALVFRQEKLTLKSAIGCLIGFSGVVLVNLGGISEFHLSGEGAIFISSACYGCSSVFIKAFSKDEDPVALSGWQFLLGGTVLCAIGLLLGGKFNAFSAEAALLISYLAMLSAVAYSVWGLLLKYNPVSIVTVCGFMIPVFGVAFSALFLGELDRLNGFVLPSLLLVSVGIIIVNLKPKNKAAEK